MVLALAEHGVTNALLVIAGVIVINILAENALSPMLMGRGLEHLADGPLFRVHLLGVVAGRTRRVPGCAAHDLSDLDAGAPSLRRAGSPTSWAWAAPSPTPLTPRSRRWAHRTPERESLARRTMRKACAVEKKSAIIELGRRSILNFFFEHPMATYSAALAYRGLFGLFPFLLILVVLVGALGFTDYLDTAMDHASTQPYQHVPQQLEPVVEPAREQVQPLLGMLERAEKRAGGDLLIFGVAMALWSVSAVARTLTEAFNVAYEVAETRRWWKQLALSLAFGPVLALVVLVSVALMLIGPQLVRRWRSWWTSTSCSSGLWGWLRFPVALFLLAVVLTVVYRFGPNARQRFRSVVPGAALSVVLWAISSVAFSFYLATFANYGLTYGSLGAAVGLLFYLYLCASVVLFGAELNAAIYRPATNANAKGRNKWEADLRRTHP